MKFIFQNGETTVRKVGAKVVGLKYDGRRPVEVSLTWGDFQDLKCAENLEQYIHHLSTVLQRDG